MSNITTPLGHLFSIIIIIIIYYSLSTIMFFYVNGWYALGKWWVRSETKKFNILQISGTGKLLGLLLLFFFF